MTLAALEGIGQAGAATTASAGATTSGSVNQRLPWQHNANCAGEADTCRMARSTQVCVVSMKQNKNDKITKWCYGLHMHPDDTCLQHNSGSVQGWNKQHSVISLFMFFRRETAMAQTGVMKMMTVITSQVNGPHQSWTNTYIARLSPKFPIYSAKKCLKLTGNRIFTSSNYKYFAYLIAITNIVGDKQTCTQTSK